MTKQQHTFSGPGPNQIYQQALAQGEFRIQQCNGCGKHIFYPRALCNHCGSPDLKWVPISGHATVYSTSVVRQRPEVGPDYNISLVDLAEGPRMMTRVVEMAPEAVKIGMAVRGFLGAIDGETAYLFRSAKTGEKR